MTTFRQTAVLAIGDEITLGQKTDTNSGAIAQRIIEQGVRITEHAAVPDDLDAIIGALRRLALTNDLVICTGGLGPTQDDLTRRALADAMGTPLVEDELALATLQDWADARDRELSANQRLQALRPEQAESLPNEFGTAPALLGRVGQATVLCLPGPPGEMLPILERFLAGHSAADGTSVIRTRIVRVPAFAEAQAAARLGELMERDRNPLVGTTASGAVVDVRIRYEGTPADADRSLDETETTVRNALEPFALPPSAASLAHDTVDVLREHRAILTTAESCTGGLIARRVTDIPGSSCVFAGGWVTYSNDMKRRAIGVTEETLDAHGAVSSRVAQEMAIGALDHAPDATHALSVTGIAGPGGGSTDKPVGTVYIACATRAENLRVTCESKRFLFPGDRAAVRSFTANLALAMLRFGVLDITPGRLLCEVQE